VRIRTINNKLLSNFQNLKLLYFIFDTKGRGIWIRKVINLNNYLLFFDGSASGDFLIWKINMSEDDRANAENKKMEENL
jgi:hypothetical protein